MEPSISDGRKGLETRSNISLFLLASFTCILSSGSPGENFPRNKIPLEFWIFQMRPRETSVSLFIRGWHLFLPESNVSYLRSQVEIFWIPKPNQVLNCGSHLLQEKKKKILREFRHLTGHFHKNLAVQSHAQYFLFICEQLKSSPSLFHYVHYTRELLFSFLTGNHTVMMVKFSVSIFS